MVTSSSKEIAEGPPPGGGPRNFDFGLVIGIDHYSGVPQLQGALADAEKFRDWLREDGGGGVAPEHVWLVPSTAEPIAPLQDEVDRALHELVTAADAVGGGRRLYFHFSGHGAGIRNEAKDVALLLAKWSHSLLQYALSSRKYHGVLDATGLFEELVVSLDCCRTIEPIVGLSPSVAFAPQTAPCPTRSFVAYATEPTRSAFEVLEQGEWQGVFTRCLLNSLRHSRHGVSAADLKRLLEYEIGFSGQRPHVENGLLDGSRFGRKGVLAGLMIEFDRAQGQVRLSDGKHMVMAECEASIRTWQLSVERGLYKLEDSAGYRVTFDHGGEAVTRVVF